jgi:adenine-specific DNA-methyltransferase
MPTLDWIGKKAVVDHHRQVPYHLLRCDPALSVGEAGSGNLLVEGDNLLALKALLPYYAGQVKCIYIDPPYNTGDETWIYNDSVNSSEMRGWLGKVVGREGEDLSRHDKWLCMMMPRMKLLTQFLRPDGILLVSLNEVELARFRLMMEEVLAPRQYVATLVWKSRRNLDNRSLHNVSVDHEYVLVYNGGEGAFRGAQIDFTKYSNPDNEPRGPWMSDNLVGLATQERRPNLHYDLVNPATGDNYGCPAKGWRYSPETMAQKIVEGRILWPLRKSGRPRHKKFVSDLRREFAGFSSLIECGNTNEGTEEVAAIMGRERFIFPKPRSLVQSLIGQVAGADDLVLDSFAGTGTTGHAVLAANEEDGGHRRFIVIEMDAEICQTITAQRLSHVIGGYAGLDGRTVAGLGGGFRYCRLAQPLFDERGRISKEVTFGALAHHIYFTETGEPLPGPVEGYGPLLGVAGETAYYLLFNGGRRNVLDGATLAAMPPHKGPRVVYADGCRLSRSELERLGVTFKQIPYQIRTT